MGALFHAEAAAFCLAWVGIAAAGYILEGGLAGALLTFGMLALVMPMSGFVISRYDDFALERTIRWSILIGAGATLALVHAVGE